jgi:hypothetical protein
LETGGRHPAGPHGGIGSPATKAFDDRADSNNELNNTNRTTAKYTLFFIREIPPYGLNPTPMKKKNLSKSRRRNLSLVFVPETEMSSVL